MQLRMQRNSPVSLNAVFALPEHGGVEIPGVLQLLLGAEGARREHGAGGSAHAAGKAGVAGVAQARQLLARAQGRPISNQSATFASA
eukprot:CAMPEP_0197586790 /NCGR_PEP_ID=MMETSP1326-20131121/8650_1 /TAXON_ID=1155430 /ORGANISM="Genus nov. species nov., Strain RCC2288" /LENGTH=86 /DNA_ID=CAMNT_0043151453 /DNA_START=418 /DNA_END=678 /DNA_ORIENTATION=+